nr:UbiX family flavin prenyltransferase [Isorropodon fossajaponicum symbiont]
MKPITIALTGASGMLYAVTLLKELVKTQSLIYVMVSCAANTVGYADNLMHRAADVVIKEQKKLILAPRETPYSAIHLENMLKLSRLGVVIMDANPAFYQNPNSIQDLVNFVVARILDHLEVAHNLVPPWQD